MKQDSVVVAFLTRRSDAASKHATQAYFDCLRAEIEHYGIPVTVVSPGYIRTSLSVNAVTGDGSKYGGEAVQRVTAFTFPAIESLCVVVDLLTRRYQ